MNISLSRNNSHAMATEGGKRVAFRNAVEAKKAKLLLSRKE